MLQPGASCPLVNLPEHMQIMSLVLRDALSFRIEILSYKIHGKGCEHVFMVDHHKLNTNSYFSYAWQWLQRSQCNDYSVGYILQLCKRSHSCLLTICILSQCFSFFNPNILDYLNCIQQNVLVVFSCYNLVTSYINRSK